MFTERQFGGFRFDTTINVSDFSAQPNLNDNIESIMVGVVGHCSSAYSLKVTAMCDPPCANGRCVDVNRCACDAPWHGPSCELAPPDETSIAVCDKYVKLEPHGTYKL